MVNLTVLLSTFRRGTIFDRTLSAMSRLEPAGIDWELVVVDNADDDATRLVCQQYAGRLPLKYLICKRPGKNAALNYGLEHVRGDLVILTDDDALPAANWLTEMNEGARRWPDHVLFAGRILPAWPAKPSEDVRQIANDANLGRWTYSVIDLNIGEGPVDRLLPIGVNMAVRRNVFDRGMRFDETVGPRGKNYAMGSEIEFGLRLRKLGYGTVYLPKSVVQHQVRDEQLNPEWLIGRAYREGRGDARRHPNDSLAGLLAAVKLIFFATAKHFQSRLGRDTSIRLRSRMQVAQAYGRLTELLGMRLGYVPRPNAVTPVEMLGRENECSQASA